MGVKDFDKPFEKLCGDNKWRTCEVIDTCEGEIAFRVLARTVHEDDSLAVQKKDWMKRSNAYRNKATKQTGYVCIDNKFCCLPEENPMWPISSPFAYGSLEEAKKHQDKLGGRCIIVKVEWEE